MPLIKQSVANHICDDEFCSGCTACYTLYGEHVCNRICEHVVVCEDCGLSEDDCEGHTKESK